MPLTIGRARQLQRSALCASLAVMAMAVVAHANEPGLKIERYVHETALHGDVDAELGRFQVPESRTQPDSRDLELVFVRLSSLSDAQGPPIVYLAGGPGGSGIDAGTGRRFELFDALRSSGDVILFDQRGTGGSSPLEPEECDAEATYPLDEPIELERYLELVESVAASCAEEAEALGIALDAYTTTDSVADLEALRIALDEPKIDLLAISYGTHLAMAYLRAHPDRVRRVVLAGAEGPDHTIKLPSQFERQLDNLDALGLDGETSDTRGVVETVLERLEAQPVNLRITSVEGPDSHRQLVIGRRDLAAITMNRLRDPGSLVQLPALYARLEAGDFTDVADEAIGLRQIGGLEWMPEAMDAASGISPGRRDQLLREDETTLLGSGLIRSNLATIRGLGVRDLGEAFRAPLDVDVPTLFISGTLDGRTPKSNAAELLPGFENATHLVIQNGGHSDDLLIATDELQDLIVEFIANGAISKTEIELPAPDPSAGRARMPLTPEQAKRYVGEYERRDREIWRILHRQTIETLAPDGTPAYSNAVLQIRWSGNGFPFHPIDKTTFYIDFPWFAGMDFRFEQDEEGEVTHLVFETEGEEVRMEKVH